MTKAKLFSATQLKIIACITMAIDHVGAVLFPDIAILRIIGRVTFPIFAYLVCEGMEHTHDQKKYIRSLLIFAVLSEPLFDLAVYGELFYLYHQNTIFTLALGAITIYLMDTNSTWLWGLMGMVGASVLCLDYGEYGVMIIGLLWFYRKTAVGLWSTMFGYLAYYSFLALPSIIASGFELQVIFGILIQWPSVLAVPLLLCYNGKRGGEKLPPVVAKWGFYCFYPLHLAVLAILA